MINRGGYVALITVLVLSAILLMLTTGGLIRRIGGARIQVDEEASARAHAAATACAEQAIQRLLDTFQYAGNELFSIGPDTCYIKSVGGTGNFNRTIQTSSTVLGTTRKIQVTAASLLPIITMSSWQDVTEF